MIITIHDDFDLGKIIDCGQCFRAHELNDGAFRFICRDNVLYIKPNGNGKFDISCDADTWQNVWHDYFDMNREYKTIGRDIGDVPHRDFIAAAVDCGRGIRVLRQDAWEMLITFIISQRKNIPAIANCVETIAKRYGHRLETPLKYKEEIYAFPDADMLARVSESELRECSLGYRAPYLVDAAAKVSNGALDLNAIGRLSDDALFNALISVKGVGKKVANCVALFGYGRTARVPVDVWIARVLDICEGDDPFAPFGNDAGIIQQYVFYYMKHRDEPTK